MMVAFIDEHREEHGVEPICKVLPIAPSTYYDHLAKRADPARRSERAKRDTKLRPEIARVFDANFRVYGVRKVFAIGLERMATRWLTDSWSRRASTWRAARWRD